MTLIEKLRIRALANPKGLNGDEHKIRIDAFVAAIEIVKSHNPWTKVEDGLPVVDEHGMSDELFVKTSNGNYGTGGYLDSGNFYCNDGRYVMEHVTEWMYIPKGGNQ